MVSQADQDLLAARGPGEPRRADHRSDAAGPGHRRYVVHPAGGRRQREGVDRQRRSHQGGVVLRRPRRMRVHHQRRHDGQSGHAGLAEQVRQEDDDVDTGPQFEWVDQRGTWYSSNTYPVATWRPGRRVDTDRRHAAASPVRRRLGAAARGAERWVPSGTARNCFRRKGRQRAEPHDAEVHDDDLRRGRTQTELRLLRDRHAPATSTPSSSTTPAAWCSATSSRRSR